MGRKRKRNGQQNQQNEDDGYHEATAPTPVSNVPGVYHYESQWEMPWNSSKYWGQRYTMFSRYDEGIWMTEDAWFEVTHEPIASKIAEHVTATLPPGRSIIVDAFAGVGGNAIAFALSGRFKRVYAIEKNEAALECARHNAEIYGVTNKITFFHGDCFEIFGVDDTKKLNSVSALKEVVGQYGVIFASPPWGGPGYKTAEVFDLDQMLPYSLKHISTRLKKVTANMALYLPRTSDLRQVAACVEDGKKAQLIHYCTDGGSRAMCAYLGDWGEIPGTA